MNLPADKIAREDLAGLEKCTAVLAVLDGNDPGTIFEIGYARKAGIPVVILAESSKNSDLTMLTGSDCLTTDDLSTAVYHAVWSATR
jgi:nucleoside 2-deoxyribosyltransferase